MFYVGDVLCTVTANGERWNGPRCYTATSNEGMDRDGLSRNQ